MPASRLQGYRHPQSCRRQGPARPHQQHAASGICRAALEALVFDCDGVCLSPYSLSGHCSVSAVLRQSPCCITVGVIVESEDLHREAYNAAFKHFGLKIDNRDVSWSEEYYDMLQNKVGGGKPKMRYHFGETLHCEYLKAGLQGTRAQAWQPVCLTLHLK